MLALLVAALVVTIAVFIVTLPVFAIVRGTEAEIPFAMIIVTLGTLGVLSAQISFTRKGKGNMARTLVMTALVQSLLMLVLIAFIFINITSAYYWYPATVLTLNIILVGILSSTVAIYRGENGGSFFGGDSSAPPKRSIKDYDKTVTSLPMPASLPPVSADLPPVPSSSPLTSASFPPMPAGLPPVSASSPLMSASLPPRVSPARSGSLLI